MRENLVVHFDDERFISADKIVVKNKEGVVELQSSQNFHEEKRDNKLVIKVCKEVAQNMQELIVTLCTCDKSTTYVSITGTFCCQNIMCYSQRNSWFFNKRLTCTEIPIFYTFPFNSTCIFFNFLDANMTHQYVNKNNRFSINTHNSDKLASTIESMATDETVGRDIKFISCGTVQKMTKSEYKDFSIKYVEEYFTDSESLTGQIMFLNFLKI